MAITQSSRLVQVIPDGVKEALRPREHRYALIYGFGRFVWSQTRRRAGYFVVSVVRLSSAECQRTACTSVLSKNVYIWSYLSQLLH